MPYLILSKRSAHYRVFLFSTRARIGRAESSDIILNDPEDRLVSRLHAVIEQQDGHYVLIDKSTNGTVFRGERAERWVLSHSDTFEIADYRFTFLDSTAVERIDSKEETARSSEAESQSDDETLVVGWGEFDGTSSLKAALYLQGIVVESEKTIALYRDIQAVAGLNVPVLIQGEPGTGKEKVARTLHRMSGLTGKFIPLNCSAIPEGIFESELFGSVKGAFHNATDKEGKLELAHNGTVLLDEIGDMNLALQPKLLRFLEDKEVTRLGDNRTKRVEVRVVAASNQDLVSMTEQGTFREDLYHRLACVRLLVPPLRERKEEIPALADYFLKQLAQEHAWNVPSLSSKALDLLMAYHWPGNVRELINALLNASVQVRGKTILPVHLSAISAGAKTEKARAGAAFPAMTDMEKEHILGALKTSGGNKREAAKLLGISRDTLYRKMKKYAISAEPAHPSTHSE